MTTKPDLDALEFDDGQIKPKSKPEPKPEPKIDADKLAEVVARDEAAGIKPSSNYATVRVTTLGLDGATTIGSGGGGGSGFVTNLNTRQSAPPRLALEDDLFVGVPAQITTVNVGMSKMQVAIQLNVRGEQMPSVQRLTTGEPVVVMTQGAYERLREMARLYLDWAPGGRTERPTEGKAECERCRFWKQTATFRNKKNWGKCELMTTPAVNLDCDDNRPGVMVAMSQSPTTYTRANYGCSEFENK